MWAQLKALDVYPKIHEDMKVRTFSGAMVSIISGLLITYLFFSELGLYLTVETVDRLSVDVSRGEKLQINFDITFPHLPCSLLSVDAMDVSGSHQLDVSHHIRKQVLDSFGAPAGAEQLHQLTGGKEKDKDKDAPKKPEPPKPDPTKQPGYCGSCYGAEDAKGQCCNTCEAVRAAYRVKGWAMTSLSHIEQCVAAGETMENYKAELDRGDGCRMYGDLQVNKVAGNFHFAPGKSFQHQHMHVHDMASLPAAAFNVSHVINRLSFGQDFPGVVNPLDRTEKHVVGEAAGMVMYYVKVVPTTYAPLSSPPISTNQFSVTEHFRHTEPQKGAAGAGGGGGGGGGLPGVFFFYELSPIMVAFTEQRQSLGHFLVQLCAILGGVFTVAGFVDRIVFSGLRHLEKKMSINKLT